MSNKNKSYSSNYYVCFAVGNTIRLTLITSSDDSLFILKEKLLPHLNAETASLFYKKSILNVW